MGRIHSSFGFDMPRYEDLRFEQKHKHSIGGSMIFSRFFSRETTSLPEGVERRARQNAARGIAYLDAEHPGWETRVPETLDISNGDNCIVTHLTGSLYNTGVCELGIHNPVSLGFCVPKTQKEAADVRAEYHLLTAHFRAARDSRLRLNRAKSADVRSKERELVDV
jgi:hypothetical protein